MSRYQDIPENIRQIVAPQAVEGSVIAVQVRSVDAPQHIADDIEDLLDLSSRFWSGEQCDSCGCCAYVIERDPQVRFDFIPEGWVVRCCGDADEAERWQREGATPEAVQAIRTGCGARYSLRWYQEGQVAF